MKGGLNVLLAERLRDILWGAPTLFLLLGFGLYFTVKCGFFNPVSIPKALKCAFSSLKKSRSGNFSSVSALATALGGTVGVGSISGVALAISVGGAGSIFWMWLCSFLGMGLKYAEVALAHSERISTPNGYHGGAMYCLENRGYRKAAVAFAILTILSAAAGGGVVQAGAVSSVLSTLVSDVKPRCVIIGAMTLAVIWGGRKSIGRINTVLLPSASVLFVFLTLAVILSKAALLPQVFMRIFGEAFGLRQAVGGVGCAAMMRVGCVRGTFSHEAGMGSSPLSYAASEESDSHIQGLWGITEVFLDSFAVSTLTALSLLCTGCESVAQMFNINFGAVGAIFYGVSLGIFAFAAVISWCFYGEEALYYLSPKGKALQTVFKIALAAGAASGAFMSERGTFALADIWSVLMLIPNLFLLYKARSDIIALAKQKRKCNA